MKAKNYRSVERPFTRVEYIHGAPQPRLAKYDYGAWREDYEHRLRLVTKEPVQIRDTALEAARVAAGKTLSQRIGDNFYLVVKAHPHHVLRENKMIFGAHADRLQEGMSRAFGRPIGRAAQVETGEDVLELFVYSRDLELAKQAVKVAASKLPKSYDIIIERREVQQAQNQETT
ncbi:MAG: 50S ribosomal protein L16 [Nitrososphaerota archaeon]|nr:50S ribosomal protein L16 [Candidatus Calditenuaceae archaeon]MDW8072967.1 50S ribosomal protein L16 [Nitrososphaerota archaeon]